MRQLTRICVAIDFSPEAEIALRSAASLAVSFGAQLDLVSVVSSPSPYARVLTPVQSRLIDSAQLVTSATERLRELAREPFLAALGIESHVLVGVPFAEIVGFCRRSGDGLVVVGTRARSGVGRLLLGSTAERVLRKASVPVLVAKRVLPERISSILVPTDFSDASRPAVGEAIALAHRSEASLELLHVIEPTAELYGWAANLAGTREIYVVEPEELEPEWDAFLAGFDLGSVRWKKTTIKGTAAATQIAETARSCGADLVAMGTHGRSALGHALLGSVAEAVAREAQCSVLAVRPRAFTFSLP